MGNSRPVDAREAAALIGAADGIVILCHQKPDGDTLGSGFALLYALRALCKTARIECPDGFPPRYRFMYPGFDPAAQPRFEPGLVVAVDIADMQLLGALRPQYEGKVGLCVDHHPSNTAYAEHLLLDTEAAGTVEAVYQIIQAFGVGIDYRMAVCIYTGLATDTGCFRYSNTTARTHILAAEMMRTGIDSYRINKLMFETKSVARMELERKVMDTLEYHYDHRMVVTTMTSAAVAETGVPEEDMEGIAAIPRQIEGVDVAVMLQQKDERRWRVSMRSSEHVNASAVCARLGGGGHPQAAGCTLEGGLAEVKALLVKELERELTPAG